MTIITISKGSLRYGAEVAARVARELGHACIAREVLLEASQQFDVPEARLVRAVIDSPSFLDRLTLGKQRYVAYFRSALLTRCRADGLVYHGFAGQVFLAGVTHVLKVRVVGDREDRLAIVQQRDGATREQALTTLQRDDRERVRWSRHLYGIDIRDPELYDLVVKVDRLSVDAAAELICSAARCAAFQTSPESQRHLEDLCLAANVHAALLDVTGDVTVTALGGDITVTTLKEVARHRASAQHLEAKALAVAGVRHVRVEAGSSPSIG